MPYLEMVILETLRRYPFQGLATRVSTSDYLILQDEKERRGGNAAPSSSILIPSGTEVLIHVAGIQLDPKYYPEPEKLNPENFAPESVAKRQKWVLV